MSDMCATQTAKKQTRGELVNISGLHTRTGAENLCRLPMTRKKQKEKRMNLRLDQQLDRRFKRLADYRGEKVSVVIREAMRHSYGSCRVAITGNIAKVALEMDNSEAVIKRHYLEAVTKAQAREYFAVAP